MELRGDYRHQNLGWFTAVDHHIPLFAGGNINQISLAQDMFLIRTAHCNGSFHHVIDPLLRRRTHLSAAIWLKIRITDGGTSGLGFSYLLQAIHLGMLGSVVGCPFGIFNTDHL
jgi:hypothetical protein